MQEHHKLEWESYRVSIGAMTSVSSPTHNLAQEIFDYTGKSSAVADLGLEPGVVFQNWKNDSVYACLL